MIVIYSKFQSSELRKFSHKEDLSKVHWLADPGIGKKTTVDCFVFPHQANKAPKHYKSFLTALDLAQGMSVVAFVTHSSVSAAESQQLENLRVQLIRVASKKSSSILEELRGVGTFTDSQGVHGILELVPFN